MLDLINLFFCFEAADALLFDSFLENNTILDDWVLCGRSGVDMLIIFLMLVEFLHGRRQLWGFFNPRLRIFLVASTRKVEKGLSLLHSFTIQIIY